ncbi:MAG: hypothetical protein MMC33_004142 [Icmadophila ericetorum]|nr:hypothetical protein [Icmadophila ericetorum]
MTKQPGTGANSEEQSPSQHADELDILAISSDSDVGESGIEGSYTKQIEKWKIAGLTTPPQAVERNWSIGPNGPKSWIKVTQERSWLGGRLGGQITIARSWSRFGNQEYEEQESRQAVKGSPKRREQ